MERVFLTLVFSRPLAREIATWGKQQPEDIVCLPGDSEVFVHNKYK